MLRDINCTALDGTGTMPGTIRHSHRLREIAVQRMVDVALAIIACAMNLSKMNVSARAQTHLLMVMHVVGRP